MSFTNRNKDYTSFIYEDLYMLKFKMEHFITTKGSAISKNHFNAWLPNSSINQLFAVCKPIHFKSEL